MVISRQTAQTRQFHHSADYFFWSFGVDKLIRARFEYTILLKPAPGGVRDVALFSICHYMMNRLSKIESGIFAPCMIFLLLKDLLFQNLFIFIAVGVKSNFKFIRISLVYMVNNKRCNQTFTSNKQMAVVQRLHWSVVKKTETMENIWEIDCYVCMTVLKTMAVQIQYKHVLRE